MSTEDTITDGTSTDAMSTDGSVPAVPMPSFVDGQRLSADGLDALTAASDALRWLHARALHNGGIALGMEVSGARGARSVSVGAGYAVDRQGRELLLPDAAELPVPPVAGAADGSPATFFLCAAYGTPPVQQATRVGGAAAAGAATWQEQAQLRWLDADPALGERRGLDLVLASVTVSACALTADAGGAGGRRDDVPPPQPYVSAGSTEPGATAWTPWQIGTAVVGVQTTVTTTQAGFRAVPAYTAQLVGERVLTATVAGASTQVVVDGYGQVTDAAAGGFLFRVGLQSLRALGPPTLAPVTADDFLAVLGRFSYPLLTLYATHTQGGSTIPLTRMCTGGNINAYMPAPGGGYSFTGYHALTLQDITAGLTSFAARNSVDLTQLATQNNLDLSGATQLCITMGQNLVLTRGPAPVNAVDLVSLPDFPRRLTQDLGWHVTWVGVES